MLRFVVLALTVSLAFAGGYGGGLGVGLGLAVRHHGLGLGRAVGLGVGHGVGLGFGHGVGLGFGHGAGLALAGGYGARAVHAGPIPAAVHSTRTYSLVPVPSHYEAPIAQTIDIPPNVQPVNIIFRTQSSPLNLQQIHTPAAPQYESTRSEDAPSVLTHENYKPVIQEYREVIQPFRNIEQRIQPVIENVHTVVAKGDHYGAAPLVGPVGHVAHGLVAPAPLVGGPVPLLAGKSY